jgi:hypothetical protein
MGSLGGKKDNNAESRVSELNTEFFLRMPCRGGFGVMGEKGGVSIFLLQKQSCIHQSPKLCCLPAAHSPDKEAPRDQLFVFSLTTSLTSFFFPAKN